MANFNTHLAFSAILGGATSALSISTGIIDANQVTALCLSVLIGGLLPDIDSDNSHSLDLVFAILGFFALIAFISAYGKEWGMVDLILFAVGSYCVARWLVLPFFQYLTIHRGSLHSLLACFMFSLVTSTITYHALGYSAFDAWLCGIGVFMGSLGHLVLDEIYSVDLMNARIKASFGTAIKAVSIDHWKGSLAIAVTGFWGYYFAPDTSAFINKIASIDWNNVVIFSIIPSYLF
ncbi:MAG: metal-dependent hydrolase [Pseudomonadota bacterium]